MVYQTVKYFLVRIGLSLFFMAALGFWALYFVHEIALPDASSDDRALHWVILGVSLFFGFAGYGLIGEQLVSNLMHKLNDPGLESDETWVIRRFERLISLAYSSFFLPGRGRRFRELAIRKYADYLMSIGKSDPHALKIFLKAFLQDPGDSKFRAPLLAILGHWQSLSDREIDLLLVILKAEDYRDEVIVNHLASVFLGKKRFTLQTEPIFLKAVENGAEDAARIVEFILPVLLKRERSDIAALNFYLRALAFHPPREDAVLEVLGRSYCEGQWQEVDPVLHERCGDAYEALDQIRRGAILRAVEDERSRARKKFKLVGREDAGALKDFKNRKETDSSHVQVLDASLTAKARSPVDLLKMLVSLFVAPPGFSRVRSGRFRWTAVSLAIALLLAGLSFKYWKERPQPFPEPAPPPATAENVLPKEEADKADGSKVYTVQVAAVTSENIANRILESIQKEGVKGLYVSTSKRAAGGSWYKIRLGKFTRRGEAQKIADDLMERKVIKNYFILTVPKK